MPGHHPRSTDPSYQACLVGCGITSARDCGFLSTLTKRIRPDRLLPCPGEAPLSFGDPRAGRRSSCDSGPPRILVVPSGSVRVVDRSQCRRCTTLLPYCGALRVGACRPCWELPGLGVRSFSSGSNLAFRDSVTTFLHRDSDHSKAFCRPIFAPDFCCPEPLVAVYNARETIGNMRPTSADAAAVWTVVRIVAGRGEPDPSPPRICAGHRTKPHSVHADHKSACIRSDRVYSRGYPVEKYRSVSARPPGAETPTTPASSPLAGVVLALGVETSRRFCPDLWMRTFSSTDSVRSGFWSGCRSMCHRRCKACLTTYLPSSTTT